jgi:signal peptidase I
MRLWTMTADDPLLSLSVMPTLEAGDVLVLLRGGTPGFGELALCADPEVAGKYVIGRILGEQGDRIETAHAVVTVNDKVISTRHGCTPGKISVSDPRNGESMELTCEIEDAGGTEYTRVRAASVTGPTVPYRVTVPSGHVFLASDDRYYHDDSRDFGTLPRDSCPERVVFRVMSARGWFDSPRRMTLIH